MGVYIKGFKMPEGGYRTIEIAYDADGHPMAIADGGDVFDVIPVQPHGRLGDLDELYTHLNEWYLTNNPVFTKEEALYIRAMLLGIVEAPAIIPAEESIDIQKEFMQNWHEEDSE